MQRAENRKRGEKRSRLGWWSIGALTALAAALVPGYLWRSELAGLGRGLAASFLDHPYFSVREIKVRGGERIGGSEVVTMAGLSHGMRIWSVDPEAIEKSVARHPWVKRVIARREFPHRVVIEVEERAAKAIVVLGRLFYVDPDGFVFKEVGEAEPVDLLLLTGLKQEELRAAPRSARGRLREALRVGALAQGEALQLSEIHFLADGGVVLYPMDHRVALHVGWGDWERKLDRLGRVLALWRGRENQLAALSVNFSDQVVAKLRGANSPEGQLRSHG